MNYVLLSHQKLQILKDRNGKVKRRNKIPVEGIFWRAV